MIRRTLLLFALVLIPLLPVQAAQQAPQSRLNPARAAESRKYPVIVLFSVSWCPHCKAAKEYLTQNNIPFINRDVELDHKAFEDLTLKYDSPGVPLLVLGSGKNEVVMRGFSPELFQESLKKALSVK